LDAAAAGKHRHKVFAIPPRAKKQLPLQIAGPVVGFQEVAEGALHSRQDSIRLAARLNPIPQRRLVAEAGPDDVIGQVLQNADRRRAGVGEKAAGVANRGEVAFVADDGALSTVISVGPALERSPGLERIVEILPRINQVPPGFEERVSGVGVRLHLIHENQE
jgi:hypothetical protein